MFEDVTNYLIAGGLLAGLLYGLVARHFDLDMMQAVRNVFRDSSHRQLLAVATAMLVAILGTYWLEAAGTVDIASAGYRNGQFDWLGVLLGGLLFGIGASLGGQDAARVFVNAAGGDLRALLVLSVFIIFATITQFGLLESVRLWLTGQTAIHLAGGDAGIASMLGLPGWLVLLVIGGALAAYIALRWKRGGQVSLLVAGGIIGLITVASWYVTGVLAFDDFNPKAPSGITASGPMSRIGMLVIAGDTPRLSYAVSFVIGLAVIGFVYSLLRGQFRFTPIPGGKLGSSILGAALMGIGATVAYGCNVGQGLTGFSTLSLESLLAVVGMFLGVMIATKKRWE
ncbi:MAG: YeeE/YedE family protein [Thiohalophilus sp.]|uniref:YeeE/YedE family protein n=1 Tax=Thiohalophilus sp. TaxID=3028392 RepID=UPI00286FDE04|nr:YeeE/YedE family protein [Thiohalophilus sp.]MDR9437507.1 YeeE/YedE family protein [Thiohalophilus sp.]